MLPTRNSIQCGVPFFRSMCGLIEQALRDRDSPSAPGNPTRTIADPDAVNSATKKSRHHLAPSTPGQKEGVPGSSDDTPATQTARTSHPRTGRITEGNTCESNLAAGDKPLRGELWRGRRRTSSFSSQRLPEDSFSGPSAWSVEASDGGEPSPCMSDVFRVGLGLGKARWRDKRR